MEALCGDRDAGRCLRDIDGLWLEANRRGGGNDTLHAETEVTVTLSDEQGIITREQNHRTESQDFCGTVSLIVHFKIVSLV